MSSNKIDVPKHYEVLRRKVSLARALGRIAGIEASARRIETVDKTLTNIEMAEYIRELKAAK